MAGGRLIIVAAMTATIYFVHHGQTEWNRARRYQGRHDSPLTPEGRAQAQLVADVLARELPPPRAMPVVSSPLGRAVATAEIVGAALGLSYATDRRLAEVSLGAWEGLTLEEIGTACPAALDGTTSRDWYFRAPGGEIREEVVARLSTWLAEVDRPCIAVGHGLAGRLLRGIYAGLGPEEMLRLPVRRDGVFKLADRQVTFIAAPGAEHG
jgi:probable phosphoglycerate mutase